MFRRLALLALLAGAGLVVRELAPDISRYLKIRKM
ncbi:hypothetical protein BH23ACT2_BH23ACT2_22890 [soil metagenome]